jgi:hypothetical protein
MSGLFAHLIPRLIIGSNKLNFRVRDGNGLWPLDTTTGKDLPSFRFEKAIRK